jgi:hypothetical protein
MSRNTEADENNSGWRRILNQAVTALSNAGLAQYPMYHLHPGSLSGHEDDLDDDASMRRTFRKMVEEEYGPAAFRRGPF